MEKLTREEWDAYMVLHARVIRLRMAQSGAGDEFIVPSLHTMRPEIEVYFGQSGRHKCSVDMSTIIHDPERDRRELIESLRQQIADAGEAGEGLAVAVRMPLPKAPAVTVTRVVDRPGYYALHGGYFNGEQLLFRTRHESTSIGIVKSGEWPTRAAVALALATRVAEGAGHESIDAYLAACDGTWILED